MRGLRQEPTLLEEQAELPCRASALALALVNHDRIQQSSSAYGLHERRVERLDTVAEDVAQSFGALSQLFMD